MKISVQDFGKKLTEIVTFLSDEKGNPEWYFPGHARTIKSRLTSNWLSKKESIADTLDNLALAITTKYPEKHQQLGLTAMNNSNSLRRSARILRTLTEEGVELTGLDEQYWRDVELPVEVIKMDFVAISKGTFAVTDGDFYRQKEQAKKEEESKKEEAKQAKRDRRKNRSQEPPKSEGAPVAEGSTSGEAQTQAQAFLQKINLRAILIVVALLIGLWIAWGLWQNNGDSIMTFFNSTGNSGVETTNQGTSETETTGGENNADSGSGVPGENYSVIPDGQLSDKMVAAKFLFLKVQGMLEMPVTIAVAFLIAFVFYKIFLDRTHGGDPGDFGLVVGGMLVFAFLVWLPIGEYFFPGQGLVTKDGELITIRAIQNFVCLIALGVYLLAVAINGVGDLTPLSGGFFIAGFVFWFGQPDMYLNWVPPQITFACWAIGAGLHALELFRQGTVLTTIIFVIVGGIAQVLIFLGLARVFGATDMPVVLKYAQLMAFVISQSAVVGVVGFLLSAVGKNKVIPINGVMVGKFFQAVDSVAHDAAIALCFWGAIFLALFW
ncbi:MAG: hypothetical protein BroJett025_11210 [Patescibacteria group bacterium]|nr:MAG: hypothetical protein BroJett025_11210 [Patescibacteria group bacterium]